MSNRRIVPSHAARGQRAAVRARRIATAPRRHARRVGRVDGPPRLRGHQLRPALGPSDREEAPVRREARAHTAGRPASDLSEPAAWPASRISTPAPDATASVRPSGLSAARGDPCWLRVRAGVRPTGRPDRSAHTITESADAVAISRPSSLKLGVRTRVVWPRSALTTCVPARVDHGEESARRRRPPAAGRPACSPMPADCAVRDGGEARRSCERPGVDQR